VAGEQVTLEGVVAAGLTSASAGGLLKGIEVTGPGSFARASLVEGIPNLLQGMTGGSGTPIRLGNPRVRVPVQPW